MRLQRHAACLCRNLKQLLPENPDVSLMGAEVGVWEAATSWAMFHQFPNLHLIMVDRYQPFNEKELVPDHRMAKYDQGRFDRAARRAKARTNFAADRRTIMIASSMVAAQMVPNHSLHFVFLDASHDYESVRADILAWLPKLRSDGVLCGHDYKANRPVDNWRAGVRRAVDEICSRPLYFSPGDHDFYEFSPLFVTDYSLWFTKVTGPRNAI